MARGKTKAERRAIQMANRIAKLQRQAAHELLQEEAARDTHRQLMVLRDEDSRLVAVPLPSLGITVRIKKPLVGDRINADD